MIAKTWHEIRREQIIAHGSIFRPVKPDGKIKTWIKDRMRDYLKKDSYKEKRFRTIHNIFKRKIVLFGMKLAKRVLKEYMVEDLEDIPNIWYNCHLRMFYYCWEKAMDDMWVEMFYKTTSKIDRTKISKEQFLKNLKDHPSKGYELRLLALKLWMTEILEDTADREILNFLMFHITREMMKFYKVSEKEISKVPEPNDGKFPIFNSQIDFHPAYHLDFYKRPKWSPEGETRNENKKGCKKDKESKSQVRTTKTRRN